MDNLKFKILDSVGKIEKSQWDEVFGETCEDYLFFKTIEESGLEGFSFSYILIYDKESLVLIAPLFSCDFNLDIAVEGPIQNIILAIRKLFHRFLVTKSLFCGSPFGENAILGIKPVAENKQQLTSFLVKIIQSVSKERRIPFMIFKDFPADYEAMLKPLGTQGFFEVESFPSVVSELNFKSWDDYLKSLSHNTRKDLRRKIKRAESAKSIEVRICDNVEDIIDDVYRLYLNTYEAGNIKFEKLTKEFFILVARNMKPKTKYFLYYFDGKLAAFNLCFLFKFILIDKYIGFDYELAYKYNLYFYSWCYNVKWCLENSVSFYQVGQTDYHPKLKLGGRLVPLYTYCKHANPLINLSLRLLAKLLVPSNFDKNIKRNGKE